MPRNTRKLTDVEAVRQRILKALSTHGPIARPIVRTAAGCDHATLDRMIEEGLVTESKRSETCRLTDAGRAAIRRED